MAWSSCVAKGDCDHVFARNVLFVRVVARVGHRSCLHLACAPSRSRVSFQPQEAPIPTLKVGFIAIAAIIASLAVARQRQHEEHPKSRTGPDRPPATESLDLDEIRTAGL
jgi:hypothetical protein